MSPKDTSWDKVSGWYSDHLEKDSDTYQSQVILPNLLRRMEIKRGEKILDLACGQGFFSREFHNEGAVVTGVDISTELLKEARKLSPPDMDFFVSSADNLRSFERESFDKVVCVLAIQNIRDAKKTIEECSRVLSTKGKLFIVMNHPAFRIPGHSGWDSKDGAIYRRVDSYLSESMKEIVMHPGKKDAITTVSFHRSLQYYFKIFAGADFAVTRLEEWISHKKSEPGPHQKEEDRTRKEFPLFLFLELKKLE